MEETWHPAIDSLTCVKSDASCCCGADISKTVSVEYLYLDLKTCDRCIGTDNVLKEI